MGSATISGRIRDSIYYLIEQFKKQNKHLMSNDTSWPHTKTWKLYRLTYTQEKNTYPQTQISDTTEGNAEWKTLSGLGPHLRTALEQT